MYDICLEICHCTLIGVTFWLIIALNIFFNLTSIILILSWIFINYSTKLNWNLSDNLNQSTVHKGVTKF